jgi:hypothetical protein
MDEILKGYSSFHSILASNSTLRAIREEKREMEISLIKCGIN